MRNLLQGWEGINYAMKEPPDLQQPIARRNELELDMVQCPAFGMVRRTEKIKGRQTLVVVLHRCSSLNEQLCDF